MVVQQRDATITRERPTRSTDPSHMTAAQTRPVGNLMVAVLVHLVNTVKGSAVTPAFGKIDHIIPWKYCYFAPVKIADAPFKVKPI